MKNIYKNRKINYQMRVNNGKISFQMRIFHGMIHKWKQMITQFLPLQATKQTKAKTMKKDKIRKHKIKKMNQMMIMMITSILMKR